MHDVHFMARIGYSIGGTVPLPMPETIRELNSYKLQPNFSIGLDAVKPLRGAWSVQAGIRLENKGMYEDARVKNYYEAIERGGEMLSGRFTGDVTTKVKAWMVTVSVQVKWTANTHLDFRVGPYLSVLTGKSFTGYAHNGYLRVGDPTGIKVVMGNDEQTRGNYNFSEDMRRLQWGLDIGADWNTRRRLGFFADVTWGLNGIHRSGFHTIEQPLYPIFATVGITYKIK